MSWSTATGSCEEHLSFSLAASQEADSPGGAARDPGEAVLLDSPQLVEAALEVSGADGVVGDEPVAGEAVVVTAPVAPADTAPGLFFFPITDEVPRDEPRQQFGVHELRFRSC